MDFLALKVGDFAYFERLTMHSFPKPPFCPDISVYKS
jgi:hypothetical protein